MSGWGLGVRGKREPVPAEQQGQAWAAFDAAEEAADAAFAAANPVCTCFDGRSGEYDGPCDTCKAKEAAA